MPRALSETQYILSTLNGMTFWFMSSSPLILVIVMNQSTITFLFWEKYMLYPIFCLSSITLSHYLTLFHLN